MTNRLDTAAFALLARVLLTLVFWTSGLAKLLDFGGGTALMESHGLAPGWLFNTTVLVLQIGASLMIILGRGTGLAAGALVLFTLATIPLAHPFWAREGEAAFRDLTVALEHLSVIGGLALAVVLARLEAARQWAAPRRVGRRAASPDGAPSRRRAWREAL